MRNTGITHLFTLQPSCMRNALGCSSWIVVQKYRSFLETAYPIKKIF